MSPDRGAGDAKPSDHDPVALVESLWREHSKAVFLYAQHLLRDPDKAADVMQDVFVRVFKWCERYPGRLRDDNLRAWLRRVTLNMVREKTRRTRKDVSLSDTEDQLVEPPRDATDVEPPERLAALKKCLGKLDAADRDLVALVLVREMKPKEVARELDIKAGAARQRLFRARKSLRHCIQAELDL